MSLIGRLKTIHQRDENRYGLTKKVFDTFQSLLTGEQKAGSPAGKTFYEVGIEAIRVSDSNKLGFDKNLLPGMRNLVFNPILKLFMGIKIYEKIDGSKTSNNIMSVFKDFAPYIILMNSFRNKLLQFKLLTVLAIVMVITAFFGILWNVLILQDLPSTLGDSGVKAFQPLIAVYNSKISYALAALIITVVVFSIITYMVRNKRFDFQKKADSYLMNLLIYNYIMNHFENNALGYFYFKGVVSEVVDALALAPEYLSETEKINYYIYLKGMQDGHIHISNPIIGEMMKQYYNIYQKGIRYSFTEIEGDLEALYYGRMAEGKMYMEESLDRLKIFFKFVNMIEIASVIMAMLATISTIVGIAISNVKM